MRLIKNYKINNSLKFTVELAYDSNGISVINGIRRIPRGKYKHHVTLKGLLRLINGKIPIYALVETRHGIFPLPLCIEGNWGGYLLL